MNAVSWGLLVLIVGAAVWIVWRRIKGGCSGCCGGGCSGGCSHCGGSCECSSKEGKSRRES